MKELFDLYITWFKMGAVTFGGGYAMFPLIEKEVVEKKGWATEEEVIDYYAVSQCTPGVLAINVATFVGYYNKGILGGIVATLGVVSPSIIIISLIATFLTNFASLPVVQHALNGISLAVCVMMTNTIIKLSKNVKNLPTALICLAAFIGCYFFKIPVVIITIIAGVVGLALVKMGKLEAK